MKLYKLADLPKDVKLCPVLDANRIRQVSTPVELASHHDGSLTLPIWRMIRACLADDGVGLAAPQIGIFKQMFVIREGDDAFRLYVNPTYHVSSASKPVKAVEGCLSVPSKRLEIVRAKVITANWWEINEVGGWVNHQEELVDYKARVFQHESDHLRGISILERSKMNKRGL